eukprot:2733341-Amphidinium_carterae.3
MRAHAIHSHQPPPSHGKRPSCLPRLAGRPGPTRDALASHNSGGSARLTNLARLAGRLGLT